MKKIIMLSLFMILVSSFVFGAGFIQGDFKWGSDINVSDASASFIGEANELQGKFELENH